MVCVGGTELSVGRASKSTSAEGTTLMRAGRGGGALGRREAEGVMVMIRRFGNFMMLVVLRLCVLG